MWSKNGTPVLTDTSPPERSTVTRTLVSRVVRSTEAVLSYISYGRPHRIQKRVGFFGGPGRHPQAVLEAGDSRVIPNQDAFVQERRPHFVRFGNPKQHEVRV